MAISSKPLHHNRSLSLPSKTNPATSQLDEKLSSLKASEASCSSSLSSMKNRVNTLKNLYINIDNFLQSSHIQQQIIISQEKCIDQVLDDYIKLLDSCTTAKDILSNTKQGLQQLLSALRRKDVDGINIYLNSRRKLKKYIHKCLKSLKSKHNVESLDKHCDVVCMQMDAGSVTITMLESLLLYLSGTTKMQSGWSLVAKLMQSKKALAYKDESTTNEFEKIEDLLQDIKADEVMNLLKEMDSNIQDVEQELECLFRQLIKTRVFLLNILNH